jgi:CHAT domain-containing protein
MTPGIDRKPLTDDLLALLFREEWRNLPVTHEAESDGPAVAAALNAGEPARARRLLAAAPTGPDADAAAVTGMLGRLVEALDRNWFPGGESAVLTDVDLAVLTREQAVAAPGPSALLFVDVARFVEALPVWRWSLPAGDRWALDESRARLDHIRRAGRPEVTAPVALAVADLYMRAGLPEEGGGLYRLARRAYRTAPGGPDRVGLAACALALGDWAFDSGTRPETLGEPLQPGRAVDPRTGDPRRALDHWAAAEAHYRAAGAGRGIVVVAVRRAAVAVADGRPVDAVATLRAVVDVAAATGDGALGWLVAVHLVLATAQAGEPVDHTAVGTDLAAWALRDGSRSYARGLARLCRAKAKRSQRTDLTASRIADTVARQVFDRVGTDDEATMLSADQVDRYGVLNVRRAALVLALSELDDGPAAPADRVRWMSRATFVQSASLHASLLREPAALHRIDSHARALLDGPVTDPEHQDVLDHAADGLRRTVAETAILGPLWEAAAARRTADPDRARDLLARAEAAARHTDPVRLIAVLAAAGRRREAADIVAVFEQRGMLPDEHLAALYTRLGRFDAALVVLDRIDARGGPALEMRPWELPQLRAEALLGVGRAREASGPAGVAVAEVERHLTALDLDVFRSMATDDPVVAGVHTTAVRVDAKLDDAARSFERSDRSRAAGLGDLLHPEPSTGPDARAAVRAWQRAGAALARTVEEISACVSGPDTPPPATIRAAIAAAERNLDAADTALATHRGIRRRRLPETPPLADIQRRLGADTLLLQYHAYDDQLVAWAVTPETARVTVDRFVTADLAAAAFAFHRAASRPGIPTGGWDALTAPLAPLLKPFADDIRRCRRVVVVPYGPLASVPFHLLPFDRAPLGSPRRPVSYLPAASVAPDRPTGVRVGPPVLVVGDPAYGRGYASLPGTRLEALDVAARWGTTPFLGGDATRGAVLAAIADAGLVHLATHGSFREGSPYSTELALAGTDALTVPDLMGIGLRADLVVLGACDSGRGGPTAAGDLIGLTRALLAAGARELVVSLWPVDDRIACLTMTAFHKHLRRRPASVGAALAAAQHQVRSLTPKQAAAALGGDRGPSGIRTNRDLGPSRTAHVDPGDPCHWAPFVHIGTS